MNLIKNTTSVLATQVVAIGIQFVTSIVLARGLSLDDRGHYAVAIASANLAAQLIEFGWGSAVIYRLRRAESRPAQVMTATVFALVVFSAIAIGIAVGAQGWIQERLLKGAPDEVLYLAVLIVPFQLGWIFFASFARGLDRFDLQNGCLIATRIVRLAGMVAVLLVLDGQVRQALTVYLASQALGTLAVLLALLPGTGLDARPRLLELKEMIRFGGKAQITRLSGKLNDRLDVFLIAYFLADPAQTAVYTIASTLAAQLRLLPESIGRALYPQLAGTEETTGGALSARVARHSLFWVVLGLVAVGAAAPFLIPLAYGDPYLASVPISLILLPSIASYSQYRMFSSYFASIGKQAPNIRTQVVTVGVNLAANLVLIPRYGIVGAAIANMASNAISALMITAAFCSHTGLPLRETLWPQPGDPSVYTTRIAALRERLRRR